MSQERFRIARRRRFILWLLPLLSLALAIWACSAGGRAVPPPVTHLPASQLRAVIQFAGQYDNSPNVQVLVRLYEAATSKEVSVADNARLTCNGSDIKPNFTGPSLMRPCQRQLPGGAYRIVYTDEHGVAATIVVPVPSGALAILSPRDGSTVKIPVTEPLAIHYQIPIAPLQSSVTIVNAVASCATKSASSCAVVAYPSWLIYPYITATPGAAIPTPTTFESRGPSTPTPGSIKSTATVFENRGPATPTPPRESTQTLPAPSATMTQSGGAGTITLTGAFSEFQPGPGNIAITIEAQITPDLGGFAAGAATMTGSVSANITWMR
jgi:hypothetical protein